MRDSVNFLPHKYGDDGEITQEWIDYHHELDYADTIAEQEYRAKKDEKISPIRKAYANLVLQRGSLK